MRIVKREGIDVVITTSPPLSLNLIGAAVKRLTGIPWVADQRDSLVRNADRRFERTSVRAKEKALERVVELVANRRRRRRRGLGVDRRRDSHYEPAGPVRVIPNGSDFDDFAGLEYTPGDRFRITHTGSFFGKRNPRAFLHGSCRVRPGRCRRPLRRRLPRADREWVEELGLGDSSSCSTTCRTAARSSSSATPR